MKIRVSPAPNPGWFTAVDDDTYDGDPSDPIGIGQSERHAVADLLDLIVPKDNEIQEFDESLAQQLLDAGLAKVRADTNENDEAAQGGYSKPFAEASNSYRKATTTPYTEYPRNCFVCGTRLNPFNSYMMTAHEFKCYKSLAAKGGRIPPHHSVQYQETLLWERRSEAAYRGVATRRRNKRKENPR